MDRRQFCLAAGVAALGVGAARAEGKFEPLYNGQDLAGWHVERGVLSAWNANGPMISCVDKGGGYLATDRQYGDFVLRVEYRLPPAGNSGIGLRFLPGTWPSTEGMELQILDDAHPKYANLGSLHKNGSIYTHIAPKVFTAGKPAGEWNRCEIRCQGPRVIVHLNGVEIQNANLDDYADSLGKGKTTLARRPRKGLVGLQSHGDPVDFRNIEIQELGG
jgi:hypothetical protein